MKIYDFETFEKYYKKIKTIKLKKWEDITNQQCYNSYYGSWGKPLAVKFSKENFGSFYFADNKGRHAFHINRQKFKDTVEYVETNSELEIE